MVGTNDVPKAIRIRLQYASKCDRTVYYRTDVNFDN